MKRRDEKKWPLLGSSHPSLSLVGMLCWPRVRTASGPDHKDGRERIHRLGQGAVDGFDSKEQLWSVNAVPGVASPVGRTAAPAFASSDHVVAGLGGGALPVHGIAAPGDKLPAHWMALKVQAASLPVHGATSQVVRTRDFGASPARSQGRPWPWPCSDGLKGAPDTGAESSPMGETLVETPDRQGMT
jgi:hypothetical protein